MVYGVAGWLMLCVFGMFSFICLCFALQFCLVYCLAFGLLVWTFLYVLFFQSVCFGSLVLGSG